MATPDEPIPYMQTKKAHDEIVARQPYFIRFAMARRFETSREADALLRQKARDKRDAEDLKHKMSNAALEVAKRTVSTPRRKQILPQPSR